MSVGYQFVIEEETFRFFLSLTKSERQSLVDFFTVLSNNPSMTSDFQAKDSSGRPIYLKKYKKWIITFWADHAVKEVRILNIEVI